MLKSFLIAGTASGSLALAACAPTMQEQAPLASAQTKAEQAAMAEADAAEPTIAAPEIDFTQWTLDNGLRVIAIQDPTTATVTTSMWYDIGSKLDPEGRSGFAHLFEHILSR